MYRILVSGHAAEIATLHFDPEARSLTVAGVTKTGPGASWMNLHPTDRSLLFVTNEIENGQVQLFKLSSEGSDGDPKIEFVGERPSGGAHPASLAITEDSVIIGNYTGGTVLPIPISTSPPYFLEPKQAPIAFEGSGPNKDRQESSHPHQVIINPSGDELLIPDLGVDKLWRLKQKQGEWTVVGSISYEAGSGPRHAVLHDGILYTALELVSKVSAHQFPLRLEGDATHISTLSALPEGSKPTPDMLLAEILLSPSTAAHPEPLLYVSNRNEALPAGDTIAIFAPASKDDKEKPFRYLGSVATGLEHLRAISLGGPESQYLIAGGVNGGGVKVFERKGATLEEIASVYVEKPCSFVWL